MVERRERAGYPAPSPTRQPKPERTFSIKNRFTPCPPPPDRVCIKSAGPFFFFAVPTDRPPVTFFSTRVPSEALHVARRRRSCPQISHRPPRDTRASTRLSRAIRRHARHVVHCTGYIVYNGSDVAADRSTRTRDRKRRRLGEYTGVLKESLQLRLTKNKRYFYSCLTINTGIPRARAQNRRFSHIFIYPKFADCSAARFLGVRCSAPDRFSLAEIRSRPGRTDRTYL